MKKLLLLLLGCSFFSGFSQSTCATASPISTGTTAVGTIDGTYLAGCFASGSAAPNALWYSYTPASLGVLRINTNLPSNDGMFQSDDTRIAVYTGTCGTLTCFAALDDVSDDNYLSDLSIVVEAGVTYYIAFDDRWSDAPFDVEVSYEAASCPNALPYTENWAAMTNFACWKTFNINNDAISWQYNDVNDLDGDGVDDAALLIFPPATGNAPKDEWLISKPLDLTAGVTYNVNIKYNGFNQPTTANESFRAVMLNSQSPTATGQTVIGTATNIVQSGTFGQASFLSQAPTVTYSFTPTTSGTYNLGIHANTAAAGGILMILNVGVEVNLSTDKFDPATFEIFPNPVSDVIKISNSANVLMNSISVTDLNGRIVKNVKLNNVSYSEVNVSDLSAGMYMMTINSDKGSIVKKIVKN